MSKIKVKKNRVVTLDDIKYYPNAKDFGKNIDKSLKAGISTHLKWIGQ